MRKRRVSVRSRSRERLGKNPSNVLESRRLSILGDAQGCSPSIFARRGITIINYQLPSGFSAGHGKSPMGAYHPVIDAKLRDCLALCALPIGSPERNLRLQELLRHWKAQVIWETIEENPQLFEWGVSVQSARLTVYGQETLKAIT